MKKILFLSILTICSLFRLTAMTAPPVRLTPFTGMDFVRLEVDETFRNSDKSIFKAIIKSSKDGSILWQGNVTSVEAGNSERKKMAFTVKGLSPVLWTPNNPYLYEVSLQQFTGKKLQSEIKERVGFRSFEQRGPNIFLNGKPIFLRGIAINPPGRGVPTELEKSRAFALDYVKYMKSINVNIIRIINEEAWYDVCDELGMMVFGGNYGAKVAKDEVPAAKAAPLVRVGDEEDGGFPADYDKGVAWYENSILGSIAHHPSLMIYAMTNETPFSGARGEQWEKFLEYAYQKLKVWDHSRLYIANAGYGYGKSGDICDLHRYWGWYYSSPFTFLHIRDNAAIIPFPKKVQPITFTECVGNYTGPDGRYNLSPAHKNPGSQLNWTGHERQDLQAGLADEHQSFVFKQATEIFRRMRVINPELSGVFPFTILFYNWNTVEKFDDMNPKPVTDQVKLSYQPVLVSWECWTPNVYAGSTVNPIAHIVNDDNDFNDLKEGKLVYQIIDKIKNVRYTDTIALPNIAYYATHEQKLQIQIPDNLPSGNYELIGKIVKESKVITQNAFKLYIADKGFVTPSLVAKTNVLLYDPQGTTKNSLTKLKVSFKEIVSLKNIPSNSCLVIGENSADTDLVKNAQTIKDFVAKGGRVLCMRQNADLLMNLNAVLPGKIKNVIMDLDNPVYPPPARPSRNGYYVNPERPEHPVFSGVTRKNLRVWSDYTNWDETKKGFPQIYPVTDGFVLENKNDIAITAVLGNYGVGLEGITVAEQFSGKGSIVICGLDLANRTGLDPVADKMMLNLVSYNAQPQHTNYPLITAPIIWGEYETEKGLLTGVNSGLLVNATPRILVDLPKKNTITKEGHVFAGGQRITFNTRPGIQYVANGRRPFGPFFLRGFGGVPKAEDEKAPGTGQFWCEIPAGQNMSTTKVWNQSEAPLTLTIRVNEKEVKSEIKAGETININCPVSSSTVNMSFTGDRRLVLLETNFTVSN